MTHLVDDESSLRDLLGANVVSSEEVNHRRCLGGGVGARNEANVKSGDPGGGPVQHREAVPVVGDQLWVGRSQLLQGSKDEVGVHAASDIGTHNNHRALSVLPQLGELGVSRALDEICQGLRVVSWL